MATTTTGSTNALAAAAAGRRILGEIEETSLEDVLQRIRAEVQTRRTAAAQAAPGVSTAAAAPAQPGGQQSSTSAGSGHHGHARNNNPAAATGFPIPALETLVARHFHATRALELTVGGSHPLPLLYLLVATLVARPRLQTVVVVDLEARFDARQLLGVVPVMVTTGGPDEESGTSAAAAAAASAVETPLSEGPVTEDDLQHVHVFRVDPRWRNASLAEMVSAAERRVLYGVHRRRDRAWWGTLVVGGAGLGGGGGGGRTPGSAGGGSTLGHGVGAAVVTGYYGWLRVAAQEMDPWTKQQRQKEMLMALLPDKDVDDNANANIDDNGEKPLPEHAAPETVTWTARSPWGSFAFKLRQEPP